MKTRTLCVAVAAAVCMAVAPSRAATLTHRWSFNGDLSDSVGGTPATIKHRESNTSTVDGGNGVSIEDGKAVLSGGWGAGFLNLGAGVLGTGNEATVEFWATRNANAANWHYIFSYSIPDSGSNLLTVAPGYGSDSRRSCVEWTSSGQKKDVLVGHPIGVTYHYSIRFSGTAARIMVRNAETGFLVKEYSFTRSGWSLSSAASAGCALIIGGNPFTNSTMAAPFSFDEVRVWDGVLSDEQLSANALAGPDSVVGGGESGIAVAAGGTFPVDGPGGYGFYTPGAVTLEAGAKIRFDTASWTNYSNRAVMRFKAGSFSLPAGASSVLDFVELTDSTHYTATLEDAATIKVALNSSIPATSTWKGGTPTADSLDLASSWTSVDADGNAIDAAPGYGTTIVIPAGNTTFSIPAGYTPEWGRVLFGAGHPATLCGRIASAPDAAKVEYIDAALSSYTALGEIALASINATGNDNQAGSFVKDYLEDSQLRFDGWFKVEAAQAGKWAIDCHFDDMFALLIDGERILQDPRWDPAIKSGAYVSEGWHRFTLVCGDTSGGYGAYDYSNHPMQISVNGSSSYIYFDGLTSGSGSSIVTLDADCDWSALGPLTLGTGAVIDLNGHNLKLDDMTADYLGAIVTNTSSTTSTMIFDKDPFSSKANQQGIIKEVGSKIILAEAGNLSAIWTGAAGDGNALNANNWQDTLTEEAVVPTANHALTVAGDAVNLQIPSGSTFACKSLDIGNCTFTADCDWRGLSVKPTISGTADLAGHNLQLNDLAPGVGSSFANSSATASQVRLPVAIVNGAVTDEGLDNLSVASNVQIVMANSVNTTATANSRIGYVSGGTSSYVQTGGTFTSSGLALELGKKSGGTGLFRIEAGTAKISTINAQSVAGANALVELAGGELQASAFYLGNSSSGSAIVNQTGGTFTGSRVKTSDTSNGDLRIGHDNGGTGVYNLTGGKLTTKGTGGGGLLIGYASGATGYMTVGGAGVVDINDGVVGRQGTGYLTITNGGTVKARQAFIVGGNANKGNGVGTVKLTGGKLDALGGNTTYREILVGRYRTGTLDIGGDGVVNASYGVLLGRETTGNGTLKLSGNGVLNTSKIVKGGGKASVVIDGGTLVAKNASDGAFIDVDTLDVGAGTIDTDGHNVTVMAGAVNLSESGGSFTKTGAGTLTFPAMPSTDALTVEAGTLALSLPAAVVNRARLAHRWSFNGSTEEENLADSVGGAVAGKIGDGVSFADGAVTLSGNGNSKGSLRLGDAGAALLGTGEGATVEIWATRNDVKKWARAFDYGNDQNWWWHLTWNNGTDGTKFEVGGCRNNNTKTTSYNAPWANGTKVYIVATFKANYNGTGNPYMKWAVYDATTKARLASNGFTAANALTLSDLSSATFYLGHSQYSSDYDAAATYDEVRLWRLALPDEAIAKSVEFGPDATAEQIAAVETMAVPRTVTVAAGATLDLGGGVLSQPCVNGFGTVQNGTLNVTGVISPGGDGTAGTLAVSGGAVTGEIRLDVGDKIVVDGGKLDLTGATVTLLDPENLVEAFTFVECVNGGSLAGTPVADENTIQRPWQVMGSANRVRIAKPATAIYLR